MVPLSRQSLRHAPSAMPVLDVCSGSGFFWKEASAESLVIKQRLAVTAPTLIRDQMQGIRG